MRDAIRLDEAAAVDKQHDFPTRALHSLRHTVTLAPVYFPINDGDGDDALRFFFRLLHFLQCTVGGAVIYRDDLKPVFLIVDDTKSSQSLGDIVLLILCGDDKSYRRLVCFIVRYGLMKIRKQETRQDVQRDADTVKAEKEVVNYQK